MTRAMILAAGHGMRMRPLSETTPKPLLKVGAQTLIERHLTALQTAGIAEVVINVHYLADKIISYLGDGERYGLKILYSHEKEEILGTGGGIRQALLLLGSEPFILVSADIFTDYPITKLLQIAQKHQHAIDNWQGHLVMVDNPDFLPNGDFSLKDNAVIEHGTPKLTYAGFAVFHPNIFDQLPLGYSSFGDFVLPAIEKQAITGEHFQGLWHNIGTPNQLKEVRELVALSAL
jgi:MurNAc alpha-1-phosphate uridylyltransferase